MMADKITMTRRMSPSSDAPPVSYEIQRQSPSSCSEWSDPGDHADGNDRASPCWAPRPIEEVPRSEGGGIVVPSFLQPLLGLDFVPYLPGKQEQCSIPEDQTQEYPQHDNAKNRGASSVTPQYQQYCNDEEDYDSTERELEDMTGNSDERLSELSNHFDLGVALEQPASASSRGNRKKFFSEGRLKTALGKTFKVIKNNRLRKQQRYAADDLDATPKRRRSGSGLKSQSRGTLLTASTEASTFRIPLDQQIQSLRQLEEKAQSVRKQATDTAGRIASLTAEAEKLQQALSRVFTSIDMEAQSLEAQERRLQKLNHSVAVAAKDLSVSVQNVGGSLREGDSEDFITPARLLRRRSSTDDGTTVRSTSVAKTLHSLESFSSETPVPAANRRRANTDPRQRRSLSHSSSFMRVEDLELESNSSISSSTHAEPSPTTDDFFHVDQNVALILCKLTELGLHVSTDESERFTPSPDTQRMIQNKACRQEKPLSDWPYTPWCVPKEKDIMVWTGGVPHKGFGHDWPVVKARCVVKASPRKLVDFLLDSSQLKKYNKMSQGREEIVVLQEGIDSLAEDSHYGIPGDARILRALNKPKLLPKTIEMLSLWYTRPVPDAAGAYMIVSRSVWENCKGTPKNSEKNHLRSEMLLGVNLVRPCSGGCELTTITHVFAPGVPEMLAKRMAPSSSANMMREIQHIFSH